MFVAFQLEMLIPSSCCFSGWIERISGLQHISRLSLRSIRKYSLRFLKTGIKKKNVAHPALICDGSHLDPSQNIPISDSEFFCSPLICDGSH